jgi:acyl carrier protein
MNPEERDKLRQFLVTLLRDREDTTPLTDTESLFLSGWLDSVATVELVEFLEQRFDVDFTKINFEVALIDSVDAIAGLVRELRSGAS